MAWKKTRRVRILEYHMERDASVIANLLCGQYDAMTRIMVAFGENVSPPDFARAWLASIWKQVKRATFQEPFDLPCPLGM